MSNCKRRTEDVLSYKTVNEDVLSSMLHGLLLRAVHFKSSFQEENNMHNIWNKPFFGMQCLTKTGSVMLSTMNSPFWNEFMERKKIGKLEMYIH